MIKKVFIVCPRILTGGPENLHHLCDRLNTIGAQAYIWYFPNPEGDHSLLYPGSGNVRIAEAVEDDPDNLLIVPEMFRISEFREHFPQTRLAMYWLSFMNAAFCAFFHDNIVDEAEAIHLFNSYNAYAMIRPFLSWTTWWFFLTDFIGEEFLSQNPDDLLAGKQDLVCFNARKDRITPRICETAGIPCIPITGMTREQVQHTLRICKVYVDNGFHPGRERMPREAAMSGCVVITNKSGSAAYFEDVPIEEKVTIERDLYDLIPDVLDNYRQYYDKQAHYREVVRSEKEAFRINVDNFWRRVCEGG